MIPATVAKRIVSRFEKAVHTRACALAVGPLDHATTFEYRQAKRELLALITLLRTGENPDRAQEEKATKEFLFFPIQKVVGTGLFDEQYLSQGPPKEPSPR